MARERDAARPSAIERWVHGVSTNIGAGLVRAVDEARDAREPGASTRTMVQGVLHEVGLELGESGDGPLGRAIRATARGAVLDVARAMGPTIAVVGACIVSGFALVSGLVVAVAVKRNARR
ncbi:MAG TPA: hypothetical protein VE987_06715 [Polyangiaceae bacterium]|nr:hypothetical protein [Polyangiaceae bacterium]